MKRDKSEKYEEMVIRLGRQLASRMMLQNIGQKELAKRIGQSQATVSNLINGKTDSSMKNLFLAFEALGSNPLEEIRHAVTNLAKTVQAETALGGTLINNPDDPVFIGQKGTFFIYFCATDKYEKQIVRGLLNIVEESGSCTAELRIGNNVSSDSGFEFSAKDKIYKGDVYISPLQKAVFINLKSEKLGEMCQIVCPLLNIQDEDRKLKCNMGVATTISAGANNRMPTAHRIFMVRNKLTMEEEREIQGQLLLNKDRIHISEERFKEMCNKEHPGKEFIKCFEKHRTMQEYYEIDEGSFKRILEQDPTGFRDVCMLRLYSDAPRNNKISSKVIGSIFHGLHFQRRKNS